MNRLHRIFLLKMLLFIALFCISASTMVATNYISSNIQDMNLQVGVAKKDITPPVEVKNWVTGKSYTGISSPIFSRALVLSDGVDKAVIIHWELVDAGESATKQVREKIAEKLGIPENNIMLNAAHNHSAPWSPVYGNDNNRGKELDPWWVTRHMPRQNEDPYFKKWMEVLIAETVQAVEEANENLQPASLWIGRYDASKYMRNRRPRPVTWGVEKTGTPDGFNYKHEDWDPNVLSGESTFGPLDRTLTAISFRDTEGNNISTIFHMSCHAVSIYPFSDDLSGDWSGQATEELNEKLGGENLFLQGTAGDINPWRRGPEAVDEMAEGLSSYISTAYSFSARIQSSPLKVGTKGMGLPLTDYGRERTGLNVLPAEVQVVSVGPLAIVTLPGEPMTELGMAIRSASPFPHTIVLGYSNGNGGHYCGMPGEKEYGGYETGERTNLGTDNSGLFMVKSAIELLNSIFESE